MKTHIALNVRDVQASVKFYQKVFGVSPEKHVMDYAKFDLTTPLLNFSLITAPAEPSRVNHFGIEVESVEELANWERRLQKYGLIDTAEYGTECCFARQSKVWLTDPDGNRWEVFHILEQLSVTGPLKETGCCIPTNKLVGVSSCGCS